MLSRPPMSPIARRRLSLTARTALVMTLVTALTVLLVGLAMLGLVRDAAEEQARDALGSQAELLATSAELQGGRVLTGRVGRLLADQGVNAALVGRERAEAVLTDAEVAAVSDGLPVSAVRRVAGARTYIEARPFGTGQGVVIWQEAQLAQEPQRAAARRYLGLLVLGVGAGALAGYLLARRLTASLQRAARAARRMTVGARTVRLDDRGPAEVVELADAINQLAAALSVSESRQREFLLSVSHELRTPLSAIRGYAEALSDGVVTGDAVASTGTTMLNEAQRLDRLVSDLLDLARLGAQDFRLDLADVDLTALVSQAGSVWRDRSEREGIRFAVEVPPHPVVIRTDPTRLRQIIDGLAENALRVTPAGAPIVFALRVDGAEAVVEVRDGGPGLTSDDLAVAFERSALYERYRGIRRVATGVGLALVGGLAERLGGHPVAGRSPEGGAAFAVRLPRGANPPAG